MKQLFKNKQLRAFFLGFFLVTLVGVAVANGVYAQDTFGLDQIDTNVELGNEDIRVTIAKIIRAILGVLGIIALGIVLYGGFVWMTAGGSEEKISTAKKILINGGIGLVIVLSSFSITQFIIGKLSQATGTGIVDELEESCKDIVFKQQHPELCKNSCFGSTCGGGCTDTTKDFVAKSITPRTNETTLNNVVVRAIFNKPIDKEFADNPEKILSVLSGEENVNNWFDFSVKAFQDPLDGSSYYGVEAHLNDEQQLCEDDTTHCIREGTYKIEINPDIKAANGADITQESECGVFPLDASFTVGEHGGKLVVDKVPPQPIVTVEGKDQEEYTVAAGGNYLLEASISDDSGAGYVSLTMEKEEGDSVFGYYSGPSVVEGSNATKDEPYAFEYYIDIPEDTNPGTYTVALNTKDIDNNLFPINKKLTVQPEHCFNGVQDEDETGVDKGGSCSENGYCESDVDCGYGYSCQANQCQLHPIIEYINDLEEGPMDGAPGNWITVAGLHFGTEVGKVEFSNGPGQWLDAPIVSCGIQGAAWNDTYVVVEVPNVGVSTSSIRITTADGLQDTTVDDFKPQQDMLADGVFTINTTVRPGLCNVHVLGEAAQAAPPGTEIVAEGTAFGDGTGESKIEIGGVQTQSSAWTNTIVQTAVPLNMSAGTVGVFVTAKGEKSNGVPFTVDTDAESETSPLISSITPENVTPKSYITISGKNFGSTVGRVYAAPTEEALLKCAEENDETCHLNVTDFPDGCSNTWQPTQIIAEVPDFAVNDYHVMVVNSLKLQSNTEFTFQLLDGAPQPSLCAIAPSAGPSPNPNTVTLTGNNLGQTDKLYFWTKGSTLDETSWLAHDPNKSGSTNIETDIPAGVHSGPVRASIPGVGYSNGINYGVADCRAASVEETELYSKNFQCCTEGPDAGHWVDGACEGQELTGGYVWRFTTAIELAKPHIVTACNPDAWTDDTVDFEYPSPIPSIDWAEGANACYNSTVAVRFSQAMNDATVNTASVRVFSCGVAGAPDCGEYDSELTNLDIEYTSKILEIKKGFLDGGEDPLAKNTWYRVVLTDAIETEPTAFGIGQEAVQPLDKTKPLPASEWDAYGAGADTVAYYFDFKTSDTQCFLQDTQIVPASKEVSILGLVKEKNKPLTYLITGKGSQVCSMLNVSGLGWNWHPNQQDAENRAKVDVLAGTDHKAQATALQQAHPNPVEISASTGNGTTAYEWIDVLKHAGVENGYTLKDESDVVSIAEDLDKGPYDLQSAFTMHLDITLNDRLENYAFLLEKGQEAYGAWSVFAVNGNAENSAYKMCFHIAPNMYQCPQKVYDYGKPVKIVITWDGENTLSMYDETGLLDERFVNKIEHNNDDLVLGMLKGKPFISHTYNTFELLPGVALDKEGIKLVYSPPAPTEGSLQELSAEPSDLYINLGPPEVINAWPNCTESCSNAGLGVLFNRQMMIDSYGIAGTNSAPALEMYRCDEEFCENGDTSKLTTVPITIQSAPLSDEFTIRALPNQELDSNTWYFLKVSDTVQSIGGYEEDGETIIPGEFYTGGYQWKFKTTENVESCLAAAVQVMPPAHTASVVGEKTFFSALPLSAPNECNPLGQELDPWKYGWSWDVADKANTPNLVASVTQFSFSGEHTANVCSQTCLPAGSDIMRGSSAVDAPICGNGKVEAGEDCDIASNGEIAGTSCSYNCLRPGNTSAYDADLAPINSCGNGIVENAVGEECDPGGNKNEWQYCASDCTNVGSGQEDPGTGITVSLCGSGEITEGEECELGDPGCNSSCLNTGTSLSQAWCDQQPNNAACLNALSICGNGILESGEECDISDNTLIVANGSQDGITIATSAGANHCSQSCRLINLCSGNADIIDSIPSWSQTTPNNFRCDPDDAWCDNTHCRIAGSSLAYTNSSQCFDGVVGLGEYAACEVAGTSDLGHAPVQLVTAIGQGNVVADSASQETDILVSAEKLLVEDSITSISPVAGEADYTLQCGFTEFPTEELASAPVQYNDCTSNPENSYGVGTNSCCSLRPSIIETVPEDGAGIGAVGGEGVCRNTLISATFDKVIDEQSLANNIIIAEGHAAGYECPVNTDISTLIVSADAGPQGFWQKIWTGIKSLFARFIGVESTTATGKQGYIDTNLPVWCQSSVSFSALVTPTYTNGVDGSQPTGSVVTIDIDNALKPETAYLVILEGGIDGLADVDGVPVNLDTLGSGLSQKQNASWLFETREQICLANEIMIDPTSALFTKPATTIGFQAVVGNEANEPIVAVDEYDWDWYWGPQTNPLFEIPASDIPVNDASTQSNIFIKSTDLSGKLTAVAGITITKDQIGDTTGESFQGETQLESIFCENIWLVDDPKVKFSDDDYNFTFGYCADAGLPSNKADDLPYLKKISVTDVGALGGVQIGTCENIGTSCTTDVDCATTAAQLGLDIDAPTCSFELEQDTLRKYLFFSDKSDDVVGVQILKNTKRLSARDWFVERFGTAVGLQDITIDGYDAVSDGTNYYINALNVANKYEVDETVYNNIYLFSINADAQTDTKQVFELLLKSLEFNTNLGNHGYCGTSLTEPNYANGLSVACTSDFNCLADTIASADAPICANEKTKFQRDWERLYDVRSMQENLAAYANVHSGNYPPLASGTFIPHYTVSRWSSWGKLGSDIGLLPIDPLNEWTGCNVPDTQTCWNPDSTPPSYICPTHASVYEYTYDTQTGDYMIHVPLEYFTKQTVTQQLGTEFTPDVNAYTTERGCVAESTYTPFASECGDGVVGAEEICDAPGSKYFNTDPITGVVSEYTCNDSCSAWDLTNTTAEFTCGNSIVETGELCDDGDLNGSYGHCGTSCLAVADAYCGNNKLDTPHEYCDQVNGACYFVGDDGIPVKPEVYIVLDRSGSMRWGLWDIATAGLDQITDNLADSVDFGLALFDSENQPEEKCSYTEKFKIGEYDSIDQFKAAYNSSTAEPKIGVGTPTGEVMEYVFLNKDSIFSDNPASKKLVVLITDGEPGCGGADSESEQFAKAGLSAYGLEQAGINTYVVGFGDLDAEAKSKLNAIAEIGGTNNENDPNNKFFVADKAEDLISTMPKIVGCGEYNTNKEASCKWDCSTYGGFCGDGVVDAPYEQCDDGNTLPNDGCSETCQEYRYCGYDSTTQSCIVDADCPQVQFDGGEKVNVPASTTACHFQGNLLYSQSKQGNELDVFTCDPSDPFVNTCVFLETYADQGVSLGDDLGIVGTNNILPFEPDIFILGDVEDFECLPLSDGNNVADNVDVQCIAELPPECGNGAVEIGEVCDDGNTENGDGCDQFCQLEQGVALNQCGNGIVETYSGTLGQEVVEECDFGTAQNGIACDPGYIGPNESNVCTYCSADCRVLTVNATAFCGNGQIDLDANGDPLEACDYLNGDTNQVITQDSPNTPLSCGGPHDVGGYVCSNNCQETVSQCIACFDGTTQVRLSLLHPMSSQGGTSFFDDAWEVYAHIYTKQSIPIPPYQNPEGSAFGLIANEQGVTEYSHAGLYGVQSNPQCNADPNTGAGGYDVFFNYEPLKAITELALGLQIGEFFQFPVTGNANIEKNDYVYSPPVPSGVFRIVVRWEHEDVDDAMFSGGFYNPSFIDPNGAPKVTIKGSDAYLPNSPYNCTAIEQLEDQYFWPKAGPECVAFDDGIYVHPVVSTEKSSIQSFTIDTSVLATQGTTAAFFVEGLSGAIGQSKYKNSNLRVEVYAPVSDIADTKRSIHKPAHTFYIKDAQGTSTYSEAKYWYVFDIWGFGGGDGLLGGVNNDTIGIETNLDELHEAYSVFLSEDGDLDKFFTKYSGVLIAS